MTQNSEVAPTDVPVRLGIASTGTRQQRVKCDAHDRPWLQEDDAGRKKSISVSKEGRPGSHTQAVSKHSDEDTWDIRQIKFAGASPAWLAVWRYNREATQNHQKNREHGRARAAHHPRGMEYSTPTDELREGGRRFEWVRVTPFSNSLEGSTPFRMLLRGKNVPD